jgi:hypothetical protein
VQPPEMLIAAPLHSHGAEPGAPAWALRTSGANTLRDENAKTDGLEARFVPSDSQGARWHRAFRRGPQ